MVSLPTRVGTHLSVGWVEFILISLSLSGGINIEYKASSMGKGDVIKPRAINLSSHHRDTKEM